MEAELPPNKVVEYGYDALDRRVAKSVDNNPASGSIDRYEYYVWDGDDIVLDFIDPDGAGLGGQPLAFAKRYLWGRAVDQILAEETAAGVTAWHLADNLGSVRDLMDNTSELVSGSHVSYDAFGKILSGTPATRFAFTGQEWDSDAALYYYNARWYNPVTGTFASKDPIDFAAGDTNLTRMVGNGPTNAVDPSGLWRRPNNAKTGDEWIAENGDKFETLVSKVVPPAGIKLNPKIDKFAIKPIAPKESDLIILGFDFNFTTYVNVGKMYQAWNAGKPHECAWYDTSYLTTKHPQGPAVKVTVGNPERRTPNDPDPLKDNGYLATASAFFGSKTVGDGSGVKEEMEMASGFGQTPVPSLWIVGHGGRGAKEVGAQSNFGFRFSVDDLKSKTINGMAFFGFPEWEDALEGKLSSGFWFDREAQVYLIGCNTSKTAEFFAGAILRTTATAYGTSEFTWAVDENTMEWSDEGDQYDPNMGHAATPEEFFKMKYWTARPGKIK